MFRTNKKTWERILKRVSFAAYTRMDRSTIRGICFQQNGNTCDIVATNGHQMAVIRFDKTQAKKILTKSETFKTLIPWDIIKDAMSGIGDSCELRINSKGLHTAEISTQSNREVDYPPWEQVIPRTSEVTLSVHRMALVKTVRDLRKKTTDKDSMLVKIAEGSDCVQIEMNHKAPIMDGVTFHSDERIDERVRIGFNTRYFLEAVSRCGSDRMSIRLSGSLDPCVVQANASVGVYNNFASVIEDDLGFDYTCVVMPMRI